MGQECSHMNIWAISTTIRAKDHDIEDIYLLYLKTEKSPILTDLEIDYDTFMIILDEIGICQSDKDIFDDIFRILDTRNRNIINMRDFVLSIAPLVCNSIKKLLEFSISLIDREKTLLINKPNLLLIFKLINQTCRYVGDKGMQSDIIHDLINSTYTTAGLIDGDIYYPNYIEYIALHPIIELFISPQYQGPITSKILTDEQIEEVVNSEL